MWNIGEELRRRRNEMGLTLAEAAPLINGQTSDRLSAVERDERTYILSILFVMQLFFASIRLRLKSSLSSHTILKQRQRFFHVWLNTTCLKCIMIIQRG